MEKTMNNVMQFTGSEYDLIKKAELKKSKTDIEFEAANNERIVKVRSMSRNNIVETKFTWYDGSHEANKTAFNFLHLKELKIGKKDVFSVYGEENQVTIDHDGMKVYFQSDSRFINNQELEFENSQMLGKQVLNYLKDVNQFTSKQETRPLLAGVNFNTKYIQANDSHALKRVNIEGDFNDFTIHNESIDIITSLLSDNFFIEEYNGGKYHTFKQTDGYLTIEITVESTDGNYPVTDKMIPELYNRKAAITLYSKQNESLVKMLSKLNKKDVGVVKFKPGENELNVIQEMKDHKGAKIKTKSLKLNADNSGDIHDILFGIELLQKIAKQSEEITFNTYGDLSVALIHTEDKNVTILLSPSRVL